MDSRTKGDGDKPEGTPEDDARPSSIPAPDRAERAHTAVVSDDVLLDLLTTSADLACIVGADGYFKWVAPSWERILGWTPEELLSRPVSDFLHPADVEFTIEVLAQVFAGEDAHGKENRYRTSEGDYRTIEWNAFGVRSSESLAFATGRDVTEVRERQARLEEHARMLEMTERLASVGHWWVDVATGKGRFSPMAFDIYGLPRDAPHPTMESGITWYHPDDRPMVERLVGEALAHGRSYEFRARIIRPDGQLVWVEAAGAGYSDETGEIAMIFGIIRDITDELEVERRLRDAEKMASLGTISAGVGHEINNPLTWLSGNLDVMLELLTSMSSDEIAARRDELITLVAECQNGGERIRRIVRALRTFSHPHVAEGGRVSLEDVIDAAVAIMANEVRHRAVLECEVDSSLEVRGDDTQLVQVVVNLLTNSVHAIPEGRPRDERVSIRAFGDDEGNAIVHVADSGTGIPADVLPDIWDPFVTTKPVGTGTGLGLAIVRRIVERHGGQVEIESVVDKGTRVVITLPLATSGEDAAGARSEFEGEPADAQPADMGCVLVVDDEDAILRLLTRALRGRARVLTARDGAEAIRILGSDDDVDGVFCDMMMAEVSGMEVWRWIRSNRPELLPRTRMITGGVFTGEARAFVLENQPNMLEKPFSVRDVRDCLARMLEG